MTTATTSTKTEQKVCAQTFASLASLAILTHFIHEVVALFGDVPVAQPIIGLVIVGATITAALAWYRMGRRLRRTLAVVLGVFWSLAAFEHVANIAGGGAALDYTGLLTFGGGLLLVLAAFWDHYRPLEPTL